MRRSVFIIFVAAFLQIFLFTIHGTAAAADVLKVGYAGVSGDLAHVWIAKEAGLFAKYGLNVEPVLFRGGTPLTQSLTSGELKIAEGGLSSVRAILAGADIRIVLGYMNKFPYIFYTSKEITRPEQLKGKSVACSAFGTGSHASVILALRQLGLTPGKDVAILQIGDQQARFVAMEAGGVQGMTVAPPLTTIARQKGFYPMFDLAKSNIVWMQEVIYMHRPFLKQNPEVAKNFIKGFIEGLKLFHTDREKTIELLARFMKLDPKKDKEALDESYEHLRNATEKKPYPSPEAIKAGLALVAEDDPKAKTARPEQLLDLSILEELDKSGFIDGLYK